MKGSIDQHLMLSRFLDYKLFEDNGKTDCFDTLILSRG